VPLTELADNTAFHLVMRGQGHRKAGKPRTPNLSLPVPLDER
jgi:hypothetical protein